MPARAAGSDVDLIDLLQLVPREIQTTQLGKAFLEYKTPAHRVLDRLRLLEDLLEHEVLESTLLDLVEIPVDAAYALFDSASLEIEDYVPLAGDHAHFAVVQIHDLAGMRENRRRVAGDEILAVANADQQWAALAGANDLVRIVGRDHRDAVCPFDEVQGVDDGILEHLTVAQRGFDQVGEHLRVRFGHKGVALPLQHGAQRAEVLDDAVVNYGDLAMAIDVWMRVALIGLAMRRPAGVRDADGAVRGTAVHHGLELRDLAFCLAGVEALSVHRRDAGRIVAAVFEALEALDEQRAGDLGPDVAYNSAHMESRVLDVGSFTSGARPAARATA